MISTLTAIILMSTSAAAIDAQMGVALEAARADASIPIRLDLDCVHGPVKRQLTVYPEDVAVWGRTHQLRLDPEDRQALLGLLIDADFAGMAPRYGGKDKPGAAKAPVRLSCRLQVAVQGVEKTSVQVLDGVQSEALMGLAGDLLDVVEAKVDAAITVDSLEEALDELADGTLAPQVLSVRYVRLPESNADDSMTGAIVTVNGGEIQRQDYKPGRGPGETESTALSPERLASLIRVLKSSDITELPLNVRSSAPLELEVSVLGQRKTIIGRPGFKASDARFDAALDQIQAELSKKGSNRI